MTKRPGRPDLPTIYRGMRISILVNGVVRSARITQVSGGRRFAVCCVDIQNGSARQVGPRISLLRREHHTVWAKGWDSPEAKAFEATHRLLKD